MAAILDEEVLTLAEATRVLPEFNMKKLAVSTVWRWCRKGVKGVYLEYARVGRRIVTSREALARFSEELAAADDDPEFRDSSSSQWPRQRMSAQYQRDMERLERELDEAGI